MVPITAQQGERQEGGSKLSSPVDPVCRDDDDVVEAVTVEVGDHRGLHQEGGGIGREGERERGKEGGREGGVGVRGGRALDGVMGVVSGKGGAAGWGATPLSPGAMNPAALPHWPPYPNHFTPPTGHPRTCTGGEGNQSVSSSRPCSETSTAALAPTARTVVGTP